MKLQSDHTEPSKDLSRELACIRRRMVHADKRNRFVAISCVAVSLCAAPVVAVALDKPNPDFQAGNPIVSADVNENFDTLYDAVTHLEEPKAFVKYRSQTAQTFDGGDRLDFTIEEFDTTDGAVTHGASGWTFTAPADGHYLLSAQYAANVFASSVSGWSDIFVYVNNSAEDAYTGNHTPGASTIRVMPHVTSLLELSAGDEVQIGAAHHTTGTTIPQLNITWVSIAQL